VSHASKDRGSFWWRDLLKLCDTYRGIAKCSIGDGSTILFWSDIWNDLLLQDKFPRLFSFAKDKLISVATFFNTTQMSKLFHIPLSSESMARISSSSYYHPRNSNYRGRKRYLALHLAEI
jgi:hypothetical protein